MLRIAFIDHPYHQVTKSADFFAELLRTRFDVSHYYAGIQTEDFVNDIVMGDFDIIVLWQTEYLGSFFLAAGQRVVCIPMYDGAGNVPDYYWHHLRQARVISFCNALHGRVDHLGLTSLPVQYMKDPAKFTPTANYSAARVVFWQRLPEQGITSKLVRQIVGDNALLHVHNAPDNLPPDAYPTPEADIITHFDLEKNALAAAMEWGNVFVCPRYAEGIGMAMLEAIARGMVVIAHDAPTQNEYIADGKTGFLLNLSNHDTLAATVTEDETPLLPLDLGLTTEPLPASGAGALYDNWSSENAPASRFAQMGQATRAQAETLYQAWTVSELEILDFVEETPHPTGIKMSAASLAHLARETELWHAHSHAFIRRMGYWEDDGICLQDRKRQRKPEKKRMRRRQTWAFKGLRIVYWQIKKLRNTYRRLRSLISARL